jgi:hypothetical protein
MALICASGAVSIIAPAATAIHAKPALCETTCGGSWGARQHAQWFAEHAEKGTSNDPLHSVEIEGCKLNSQFGSQWVCWGTGWSTINQRWHFHVWMEQYGRETHWTWDGVG